MTTTFPFFEVLSYETGLPVSIVIWHVRSVRPIREMRDDNETITRIEFGNGDALDTSATVTHVLEEMSVALAAARLSRSDAPLHVPADGLNERPPLPEVSRGGE